VADRYGADVLASNPHQSRKPRSVECRAETGLVVEDPQSGFVGAIVGVEGDRGRGLAMALQYGVELDPAREVRPGLDVIPGGPLLAGIPAAAATTEVSLADNLRSTLSTLCAAESYSLVLIDSGPGDATILDSLLGTARYLLVPSSDDSASLEGVELLAKRYLRARKSGADIELLGVVLFTRAFTNAKDANEEAAAGALYSTFFIAAYVLARCGEKLSQVLLSQGRRRDR